MYQNREEVTQHILRSKVTKQLKWAEIANALGTPEPWTVAMCLGQMASPNDQISRTVIGLFDLDTDAGAWLEAVPDRGTPVTRLQEDPFLQRLLESASLYGPAIKELAAEDFGDGVMSTADMTVTVEKVAHPSGDRIKIAFEGRHIRFTTP